VPLFGGTATLTRCCANLSRLHRLSRSLPFVFQDLHGVSFDGTASWADWSTRSS